MGEVKLNELYHVTTEDRLLKMYMREYEKTIFRLKACSKYAGRLVEQTLAISDMKDISINAARKAKAFIQKASSIGQNYYPEMLGKMFLINTSTIFKIVWALVKGFMDKKTRDKMIMLGSDYRSTLLEYVDKENLPTFLGGTCTCSHIPGGCIYSDVGPWNPEGGMEC